RLPTRRSILSGGSTWRSSSSVWFTCRAGNGTNVAVANIDDLIRGPCLCRVRRLKHRESVRGEKQEPKHECYNGWTDYLHTTTVPCAGIRLPLRLRRISRCYRRDECAFPLLDDSDRIICLGDVRATRSDFDGFHIYCAVRPVIIGVVRGLAA